MDDSAPVTITTLVVLEPRGAEWTGPITSITFTSPTPPQNPDGVSLPE